MLIRLFLALMALIFAAFGLVALADPIAMTARLGVDVSGPNAAYELRGIYGGVSLGAAILCAGGALRARLLQPALWFLIVYMGGYVFARAAALLLGPPPTASFAVFVAFETVCLAAAVVSLRAVSRP